MSAPERIIATPGRACPYCGEGVVVYDDDKPGTLRCTVCEAVFQEKDEP